MNIFDLLYDKINFFLSTCILCKSNYGIVCNECDKTLIACHMKEHIYNNDQYKLYAPYVYTFPMNKLILQFKYFNKIHLATWFAKKIISLYEFNHDIILVPIPISKYKLIKRGYNQAFLLSKAIGKLLNINVEPMILSTNNNKYNINSTHEERYLKAQSIFINDISPIISKNIIIVDDILTSGNTINQVIKLLKPYVNNIEIIIIAKT